MGRNGKQTIGTMTGTIKRMVRDRGFGFLAAVDGTELFFHRSSAPQFDALIEGDRVTFITGQSPKGPRAEQVERA